MYDLHLHGEKIYPYKGIYYRPAEDTHVNSVLFEHILKDINNNDKVYGLRKCEIDNFVSLASIHNVNVIFDN